MQSNEACEESAGNDRQAEPVSRRNLLNTGLGLAVAGACAACVLCGTDAFAQDQGTRRGPKGPGGPGGPGEPGGPGRGPGGPGANVPTTPVKIGTAADFAKDDIYDKFLKTNGFYVMRRDNKIFASSARCTHKGTMTKKAADGGSIVCPAHDSTFSEYGTPTGGPAKTALPRLGISQASDGTITVDPGKKFGEKDWEKPETFVEVKA
jgi:Rieske Fe-S protein